MDDSYSNGDLPSQQNTTDENYAVGIEENTNLDGVESPDQAVQTTEDTNGVPDQLMGYDSTDSNSSPKKQWSIFSDLNKMVGFPFIVLNICL